MLKNKLYTFASLEEQDNGKYRVEVTLDPTHTIFEGHFPSQPVLPGVCLMEILKEILREVKNKPLNLKSAANIKYLKTVDPGLDPRLVFEVQVNEEAGELKVNATSFLQDGSPNFKIKASFT